jgi:hypothetical protein
VLACASQSQTVVIGPELEQLEEGVLRAGHFQDGLALRRRPRHIARVHVECLGVIG